LKVAAEFVTSAIAPEGFPRERLPEIAFAGRSNVGKSTLINALVRQSIARTSAAPGKTRLANFYRVHADATPPFHLVDLPGYGYTRAPRHSRGGATAGREAAAREFAEITGAYFAHSASLVGVLLLVDSRHPGLDSDRQAWEWLSTLTVARGLVATKVDKLTQAERSRNVKELHRIHENPVLGVSAQTGEGLKELWKLIDTLLRPRQPETPPPPSPNR
jgi:GTP-binding protein